MEAHHHRSTVKQQNKAFKSKHASKGQIKKKNAGKVGKVTRGSVKASSSMDTKAVRRNKSKVAQLHKKELLLENKRIGGDGGPPKIVGLVSLGAGVNMQKLKESLFGCAERPELAAQTGPATVLYAPLKHRFTFVEVPRDMGSILDIGKVADLLILAIPVQDGTGVDDEGELFIELLQSQGMPSAMVVLQNLDSIEVRHRADRRKHFVKYSEEKFPLHDSKVLPCDTPQDAVQIFRYLSSEKVRTLHWRENHPYMLVDKVSYQPNTEGDAALGTLSVSGYLRTRELSANHLVHIVNMGTFQLHQIEKGEDPCPSRAVRARKGGDAEMGAEESSESLILEKANPEVQESLQSENKVDTMANEQTWPTEEEMKDADDKTGGSSSAVQKKKKKIPKGFSSYQAAWIISDSEGEDSESEGEEEGGDQAMEGEGSQEESESESESEEELEDDKPVDAQTEVDARFDIKEDEEMTPEALKAEKERLRQQSREDLQFPDEVETPDDQTARTRFQKFRGMKSFRTSPWDPKENLPLDYAKIVQFENFRKAMKRIISEDSGVGLDTYVTIRVANVPAECMSKYSPEKPLLLFGLLKHEQRYTLMNTSLKRQLSYTEPVKSKEEVFVSVGFRTFKCNPVFSHHSPHCEKHKFERFFQPGHKFCIASFFAPVSFPPAPVLMFKKDEAGRMRLVASGSVMSIDPDRIILKRIILTGYIFKVHKKQAVVRFMFNNPDDVRWFKPIELYTKDGLTGHIIQPLGTHGLMKVQFDGQVKSHDVVCMNLYKRIFPNWTTELVM